MDDMSVGFRVTSPDGSEKMQVCRSSLIEEIASSYVLDEYDDQVQHQARGTSDVLFDNPEVDGFVRRNLLVGHGRILDIGCGVGRSGVGLCVSDAIEPCWNRYQKAKEFSEELPVPRIDVRWAVAEALPYEPSVFGCVLSMGSVHYFRSQLEAFFEINRVLRVGGRFIFDTVSGRNYPYGGVTLDAESLQSLLRELGFSLLEIRKMEPRKLGVHEWTYTGVALEKKYSVTPQYMRKLQLVMDGNRCKVNNFVEPRDQWLL